MQILTSGSFINLDNGEKIEQLIFTAKAIADSAVQTEGFVSSEENNKRLALEIWQGAEYMTREHERARIQNLFVDNFLERLSEIAPDRAQAANDSPGDFESPTTENSPLESNAPKDEFLGFVTSAAESEIREAVYKEEAAAGNTATTTSVEIFSTSGETAAMSVQDENAERETAESVEDLKSEIIEAQTVEPETVKTIEPKQEAETLIADVPQAVEAEKSSIGAITLPEKEPYRWDDCTVTATIQLLPVESGTRRAVLSVRTHDFAPQISVIELSGAATPEILAPSLEKAFEKYKTDLPVKVMDKMKREKSTGKKQQSKTAQDAKTNSSVSNSNVGSQSKSEAQSFQARVAKPESSQAAPPVTSKTVSAQTSSIAETRSKPSVKTSKPEDNAQGSLFGF